MCGKLLRIGLAQRLGLGGQELERPRHLVELDAARIGQRFLRRVHHLHEVALDARVPRCGVTALVMSASVSKKSPASTALEKRGMRVKAGSGVRLRPSGTSRRSSPAGRAHGPAHRASPGRSPAPAPAPRARRRRAPASWARSRFVTCERCELKSIETEGEAQTHSVLAASHSFSRMKTRSERADLCQSMRWVESPKL